MDVAVLVCFLAKKVTINSFVDYSQLHTWFSMGKLRICWGNLAHYPMPL
jgi:hypothetical protein